MNPFQYMLTRGVIGRKISRWIVILQEFDLDFVLAKSKKSLVFAELISELPVEYLVDHIFRSLVWRYTYLSSDFEVPHFCFS
jgi:hypothetical protein